MPPDPDKGKQPDEPLDITVEIDARHEWRMQMLEKECGFSHFEAFRLSVLPNSDWHQVKKLHDAGCDFERIMDILG